MRRQRPLCLVCGEKIGSATCKTTATRPTPQEQLRAAMERNRPMVAFGLGETATPARVERAARHFGIEAPAETPAASAPPAEPPPRRPAETWPVGHFIESEMLERGWTRGYLAWKANVDRATLDALIDAPQKGVRIGHHVAACIAKAFDTSAEMWISLDNQWHDGGETGAEP